MAVLTIVHYPSHVDDPSTENDFLNRPDYRTFYGAGYYIGARPPAVDAQPAIQDARSTESDPYFVSVRAFVRRFSLENARVLEVGAGRGDLQDVVDDYTGLEISGEQRRFFRKPFVEASATSMPFKDGEFGAIWTINVLEHVPKPEQALIEMRRVLKDKGLLYLQVAWQCRTWAAEGYQVRPYSDFDLSGKLVKLSIPLRDSVAYRALYTFPIRLIRLSSSIAAKATTRFQYNLLTPNYEKFWQPDSDAINSMDPYEAILWFQSRGDELVSHDGAIDPFFVRTGTLIIRINKRAARN